MDRPSKVYLDEPIQLHGGGKIGHTLAGLHYMVEHHTKVLEIAKPHQMADPVRQHVQARIAQYKQHIEWYEQQNKTTADGTAKV